jgi:hypothetical protein
MAMQRPQNKAFDKCPQEWIEARDIERSSIEKATWIPLLVQAAPIQHGRPGTVGHRKAYEDYDSIIVPLDLQKEFKDVDWQSVSRNNPDAAWADDKGFYPPGSYYDDPRILHPIIRRSFETGEPNQWDLLQEIEVGLRLLRIADRWIRPEENDVEVAKLERDNQGSPTALLFRAEHLRDYLCAKKAALLLTGFSVRDAVEESFPGLQWGAKRQTRTFERGTWEGAEAPIHEGGGPYGVEMNVLKIWRESVDPNEDVPRMPLPAEEPEHRSESFKRKSTGRKVFMLSGRIWTKQWLPPAKVSPRIRRDKVEAPVHFQVENQEHKTLAGEALREYRGWLWFKPSVIQALLVGAKSRLKWFTQNTGEVGCAANLTVHFGVNKLGLINLLGKDMAELPEWAQKIWVAHNASPEGGLSEELHMAQNLASPAATVAPEVILGRNLQILQKRSLAVYGQRFLQQIPPAEEFFRRVHRFYCASFDQVCELAKEIHRIVSEAIDIGVLNAKVDPGNAPKANKENLRQIKRLALWLDTLGQDGRKITQPLAGIADLRQGSAHTKGADLKDSLALFGIPPGEQNLQAICCELIGQVANCVAAVADALPQPPPST